MLAVTDVVVTTAGVLAVTDVVVTTAGVLAPGPDGPGREQWSRAGRMR
jgi:hypothetical protein